MSWLLRTLRLLSLVVWIGGLLFFVGVVTLVAFQQLPSVHEAGIVVRGCLLALHRIGLIVGLLYVAATLALVMTQRDSHPLRAAELLVAVLMLAATAWSQFLVIPRMERARLAVGGDIAAAPAGSPDVQTFNRLHPLSVKLEGGVLLGGLVLVLLAPIRQTKRYLE